MTRAVLDASVLLSATVGRPDSPPSVLSDAARSGRIEIVVCDQLLDEVHRGLMGPYFRQRVTDQERVAFVSLLTALAVPAPTPSPARILRDPRDDYLVELAVNAGAEAIVTGDPRSPRSRRARAAGRKCASRVSGCRRRAR